MRLHHLEATAFGPFAGTVPVDFDDLSSAGLFLLTGPMGSGKTSILDAVCFALYGDVPGDRNHAKRFRCDTADPGVAPRVTLEATLSGRRFRIARTPAWVRPKKRGSGMTTQQASVLVEERVNGEWAMSSTRLDEAGHLLTGLIGMNMTQFCQVAMLPQGRFQMFLRAKSEDRHTLLQQLFSTQRFEDIERWVRDHTRSLHRQAQELQRGVSRVVSRILEATDQRLPEAWSGDDLAPVMADGSLPTWVGALVADARAADESATETLAQRSRLEREASAARDTAHRLAELQARAANAQVELSALEADDEANGARIERLARAHRAAPVVPLHRLVTASSQLRDRSVEAAATAQAEVAELLGVLHVDADELAQRAREARAAAAAATASLPDEHRLQTVRARIAAGTERTARLEADETSHAERAEALPDRITDLGTRLGAAREAAVEAERLTARVADLASRLTAHDRIERLRVDLSAARDEHRTLTDVCQALKEHWLELCEARIRGMAAEIATDLAVGASCPVCGSADHPHKAEPAPGAPTPTAEKDARKRLDDAEGERTAHELKVHELTTGLALLEREIGTTTRAEVQAAHEAAEQARSAAARQARARGELEAALVLAERSLQAARTDLETCRVELSATRTQLDADRVEHQRIAAAVDALLDGSGHSELASLVSEQHRLAETCEEALRLERDSEGAIDRAVEAKADLAAWLAEHDFTDAEAALGAVLPDPEARRLEAQIARHSSRVAATRAVLDDPAVAEAVHQPAGDVAEADALHASRVDELGAARSEAQVSRARAGRLTDLRAQLETALDAWRPLHAAYAVAAELAAFVEGKSADNELRMRLSAYVLAWRLTQVVAAANERLLQMSDRRYSLEHTGRRGAGESRGGLSLLVLDEWSGEHRDPATLSGGETFVVSLALALGLADVVTQEAGGAELDTLFVDEGFGSLDSETLDDVMDTLDTLRDGGRVVGVVSHVAEMRSRIPTQLCVAKDRTGSSVTITRAAG